MGDRLAARLEPTDAVWAYSFMSSSSVRIVGVVQSVASKVKGVKVPRLQRLNDALPLGSNPVDFDAMAISQIFQELTFIASHGQDLLWIFVVWNHVPEDSQW
jgi:hypothetical protein